MQAQFELLHPFKDGNGRIGRILIPLFLYQKRALSHPMFYLSSYLESHREEYYLALQGISRLGNWNEWIAFFLDAVKIQAKENSRKVRAIMVLYDEMKQLIHERTHSQYSIQVLDAIFNRPIFKTTDFIQETGIQKPTAMGLLRQLKAAEVLKELQAGSGRRSAVLCFPALLTITEQKQAL
jgi:Fic family protein